MTDQITIRPLGAGDMGAWAPLWEAYLAFYGATRPPAVFDPARRLHDRVAVKTDFIKYARS